MEEKENYLYDNYFWLNRVFGKTNVRTPHYRKNMKPFLKFLIKHGAYQCYINNVNSIDNEEWTNRHYPINNCHHFINDAFLWETTPEGHNFWSELHEKWLMLYSRIP